MISGLIIKAVSGFYYVETDIGLIECRARGKFRNTGDTPFVGDRVELDAEGKRGTIIKILPRNNFLLRPAVANIDKLFIISSSSNPAPNQLLIDRMIALCEHSKIVPIIVFNKNDIKESDDLYKVYSDIGYTTILTSAKTMLGIEKIKGELKGCISAFTGNSGVGKSSILNSIFPNLNLSTNEISEKLGRGRHTTRYVELFHHDYSGYVADTPGFSAFDSNINSLEFKKNLADYFIEFKQFSENCKFSDCKHIGESGCEVCKAVENQNIDLERHNSYVTIYNELKDLEHWNLKK